MPFNGSGGFEPLELPVFPAIPGTTILASQFNTVINDILQGLGQCLTRDGQGAASAHQQMGGYKHKNAADATARGEYLVFGQDGGYFGDSLDLGALARTVAGTPHLDFHSSANTVDYDSRIIASGGSSASGQGGLNFLGSSFGFSAGLAATKEVALGDGMYAGMHFEAVSHDANPVGIGFHRVGQSAATLYHLGDGDNLLRVRRWAGGDYKVWHQGADGELNRYRGEVLAANVDAVTGNGTYRVNNGGDSSLLFNVGGVGGSTPGFQMLATYGDEFYFRASRDTEGQYDGLGFYRMVHSGNYPNFNTFGEIKSITDLYFNAAATKDIFLNFNTGDQVHFGNGAGSISATMDSDGQLRKGTKRYFHQDHTRANWVENSKDFVAGGLGFRAGGNNTMIFDASSGFAPDGVTAVGNTNPASVWFPGEANLMVWNGAETRGVRVDSCRLADEADAVAWADVTGRPTNLSHFINDLPAPPTAYITGIDATVDFVDNSVMDYSGPQVSDATLSVTDGILKLTIYRTFAFSGS